MKLFFALMDKSFFNALFSKYCSGFERQLYQDDIMKHTLIIIVILIISSTVNAQNQDKNFPITIGYFSQAGWQPGAKIGTQLKWKTWETETRSKQLLASPQIGFYTYIDVHTSYLLNIDVAYQSMKKNKPGYSAWSIGLGYMNQSQITERKINLSDGSEEKIRENWGWFLPTANYEFGRAINSKISWYSKFSYGLKIATSRENAALFFVELGMKFNLL